MQNLYDDKCFLWSVLARLHPIAINSNRMSQYRQYENELNIEGIDYPVPVTQIKKFERQNANISVKVFGYDSKINEFGYRKVKCTLFG